MTIELQLIPESENHNTGLLVRAIMYVFDFNRAVYTGLVPSFIHSCQSCVFVYLNNRMKHMQNARITERLPICVFVTDTIRYTGNPVSKKTTVYCESR